MAVVALRFDAWGQLKRQHVNIGGQKPGVTAILCGTHASKYGAAGSHVMNGGVLAVASPCGAAIDIHQDLDLQAVRCTPISNAMLVE
jgi:hypothetical protein